MFGVWQSGEKNLETKVGTVKEQLNFSTEFRMRQRDQQKLSNEKNESMKTFFCSSPSGRFFSLCVKRARKL